MGHAQAANAAAHCLVRQVRERERERERDNSLRALRTSGGLAPQLTDSGAFVPGVDSNQARIVPGTGVFGQLLPQSFHLHVCRDRLRKYAAERRRDTLKRVKDFYLKAKARIWP